MNNNSAMLTITLKVQSNTAFAAEQQVNTARIMETVSPTIAFTYSYFRSTRIRKRFNIISVRPHAPSSMPNSIMSPMSSSFGALRTLTGAAGADGVTVTCDGLSTRFGTPADADGYDDGWSDG